jgi:quaternary ammonium compound-resistance protein SugE
MSPNTAWTVLILAGLLETGWAIGLKLSGGMNFRAQPLASSVTLGLMIVSMYMLNMAVRHIPVGTGYAVWVGIGAAGAAVLGMILFAEPATLGRIACLVTLVASVVGLKYLSP